MAVELHQNLHEGQTLLRHPGAQLRPLPEQGLSLTRALPTMSRPRYLQSTSEQDKTPSEASEGSRVTSARILVGRFRIHYPCNGFMAPPINSWRSFATSIIPQQ